MMTNDIDDDTLLTPQEAAEKLRVSVSTLARWRQCGDLGPPYIRLGNKKNSPIRYLPLRFTESGNV